MDTQLVAGLISHWTVTLDWPSAAVRTPRVILCIPDSHTGAPQGGTSRTTRLTLNQYALLSVLSNAKVHIFLYIRYLLIYSFLNY